MDRGPAPGPPRTLETEEEQGRVPRIFEETKMYNFEFEKPTTVADAVAALGGDDAQALGGGQTLIPTRSSG